MAIPILGDLINGVKDIVSEVVVDKDKRDQVNLQLKQLEDQAQARLDAQVSAQIEVNKVEAASGSVFVAGWRPAVGWVGAAGFAYLAILQPLMAFFAVTAFGYKGSIPTVDDTLIITVMTGMLGFGVQRSFEKVKGVSTNDYTDTPKTPVATSNVEVTPQGAVSVETKGAAATPVVATPSVPKQKKKFHIF